VIVIAIGIAVSRDSDQVGFKNC